MINSYILKSLTHFLAIKEQPNRIQVGLQVRARRFYHGTLHQITPPSLPLALKCTHHPTSLQLLLGLDVLHHPVANLDNFSCESLNLYFKFSFLLLGLGVVAFEYVHKFSELFLGRIQEYFIEIIM